MTAPAFPPPVLGTAGEPRVVIVGAGHVGLPLAMSLAERGVAVGLVDLQERIDELKDDNLKILEPGLAGAWRRARDTGLATLGSHGPRAAVLMRNAALTVLCVPAPTTREGQDLTILRRCALDWAQTQPLGLLAVKSTVLPGTTRRLAIHVRDVFCPGDDSIFDRLLFWPEFLAEGTAMRDAMHPARTVFGWVGDRQDVEAAMGAVNPEAMFGKVVHTTAETAEASKYAANTLLAARLTAANEVALQVERLGGDGAEAVRIAGLDPRLGSSYLQTGAGWGGSCFPKDVTALANVTGSHLFSAILEENDRHTGWLRDTVEEAIHLAARDVKGPVRVAWLGLSFKAGTADRRTTPSEPARRAVARRRDVVVYEHDPSSHGPVDLDEVDRADVIVVAVAWPEYTAADFATWLFEHRSRMLPPPIVIDARNALNPAAFEWARFVRFGETL